MCLGTCLFKGQFLKGFENLILGVFFGCMNTVLGGIFYYLYLLLLYIYINISKMKTRSFYPLVRQHVFLLFAF